MLIDFAKMLNIHALSSEPDIAVLKKICEANDLLANVIVLSSPDMQPIFAVVAATKDTATTLQTHRSMFSDNGEYKVELAFDNTSELDKLKAARVHVKSSIDKVTALDEMSDLARTCTAASLTIIVIFHGASTCASCPSAYLGIVISVDW